MSRPVWKLHANMGDHGSFLDYGGELVYVDKTGHYPPEVESWDPEAGEASRVVLDKCTFIGGILSDNKYHPESPAWFADKLDSISSTVGTTPAEVIRLLCSDNPCDLAEGYRIIASTYGWFELDQYPLRLTRNEANRRYLHVRNFKGG